MTRANQSRRKCEEIIQKLHDVAWLVGKGKLAIWTFSFGQMDVGLPHIGRVTVSSLNGGWLSISNLVTWSFTSLKLRIQAKWA